MTATHLQNITPEKGSHNGGQKAVLTGSGLLSTEKVVFGDAKAQFTVDSDTQITVASTPAGQQNLKVDVKAFKDGQWSNEVDYTYT